MAGSKIDRQKRTVEAMIRLYCRRKEGNRDLCPDCLELLEYALSRLSHCPFGEAKHSCRRCAVHCYSPARREKIRIVMRWAGPRMILFHPVMAFRHLFE